MRRMAHLDNLATSLGCTESGKGWAPALALVYLGTPPVGSIEAMAAWLALEVACPTRDIASKLVDEAWRFFPELAHPMRRARKAG